MAASPVQARRNEIESSAGGFAHRHRAFGLTVGSYLFLPELPLASGGDSDHPCDVEIVVGRVPAELPDAIARGPAHQIASGRFLLFVEGVARYLVVAGKTIVIEPDASASEDDIRAYLLTMTMGALLHQRNDLVLHGSAIETAGGAVAFLGYSQTGKSTLAAGFRRRGYPIITDDLCVVRPQPDGRMAIQPSFPHMKLWLDTLEKLGMSAEGLRPIRQKLGKRALPIEGDFCLEPKPVRKLYVLRVSSENELFLMDAQSAGRFRIIKNQTYRFGFLAAIEQKTGHFQQAMTLAQQVPISIVVRPREPFRLDELIALIEKDLQG